MDHTCLHTPYYKHTYEKAGKKRLFLLCSAYLSQTIIHLPNIVSTRVGTPPFLGTPLFLKQIKKVTPLFLRAIQIGLCKLYETLWDEGVTLRAILNQLRISLSLLFILSGSTLYLLLTLALVRYCL